MITVGSRVRFHDYYAGADTWLGVGTVTAIDGDHATIRVTHDELSDEPCDELYPDPVPLKNCEELPDA